MQSQAVLQRLALRMAYALVVTSSVLFLFAFACFLLVLRHAFQRSLGTGVMVLCIPFYPVFYGFSQFEHRHRGIVLAGWLGGFVAAAALQLLGFGLGASVLS